MTAGFRSRKEKGYSCVILQVTTIISQRYKRMVFVWLLPPDPLPTRYPLEAHWYTRASQRY